MFDPLKSKTRVLLYSTLTFLFGVGLASSMDWTARSQALTVTPDAAQVSEAIVQPALDLSSAFVTIAEEVTPAVVRIQTERPGRTASGLQGFFDLRRPNQEDRDPTPQFSGGSGFLISADGYIMTNNHVVADANDVTVYTRDGLRHEAEIVGTDPTTDVAVIKIAGSDLPHLRMGTSADVRVGEWVLAVGNPGFGGGSSLDYTVTAGIVSAIGRPLQLIQRELARNEEFDNPGWAIENFIQTDAVINPGNSGGPMVNLRGEVVGINSAIASQTGFYQGYGFAIPIDLGKRVGEDLVEYGEIRRSWLGVSMRRVDDIDAEAFGLPRVGGALVTAVNEDSPADDAGLEDQDVITAVDGQPVTRSGELQQIIAERRPGDRVTLEIYRDGRPRTLEVRLGEAPITRREATPARAAAETSSSERLGLEIRELTPEVAAQLGYENDEGVVIADVTSFGPAFRRGIQRPGERVIEINNREIQDMGDVRTELNDLESGQIVKFVLSDPEGNSRIVTVRVP